MGFVSKQMKALSRTSAAKLESIFHAIVKTAFLAASQWRENAYLFSAF